MKKLLFLASLALCSLGSVSHAGLDEVAGSLGYATGKYFMKWVDVSYYDYHDAGGNITRNGDVSFPVTGYKHFLVSPYSKFDKDGYTEVGVRLPVFNLLKNKLYWDCLIEPLVFHNFTTNQAGFGVAVRKYLR